MSENQGTRGSMLRSFGQSILVVAGFVFVFFSSQSQTAPVTKTTDAADPLGFGFVGTAHADAPTGK